MSKKVKIEDIVEDFISLCCIKEPDAKVKASDFYNAFQDWYVKHISCCHLPSAAIFSRILNVKFKKEKTCGGIRHIGLKLKYKPCPFCGNIELIVFDEDIPEHIKKHAFIVICGDCGTRGPWGNTEIESIERWNKRKI